MNRFFGEASGGRLCPACGVEALAAVGAGRGSWFFFKKRFSLKTILLSRESYGNLNYPKLGICIFMVGLTSRVFAIAEATMTGGHKNQPTTTTRRRRRRRRTTTTTSHNQQNLLWPCEILKTDAFIGYISKMYLSKKGTLTSRFCRWSLGETESNYHGQRSKIELYIYIDLKSFTYSFCFSWGTGKNGVMITDRKMTPQDSTLDSQWALLTHPDPAVVDHRGSGGFWSLGSSGELPWRVWSFSQGGLGKTPLEKVGAFDNLADLGWGNWGLLLWKASSFFGSHGVLVSMAMTSRKKLWRSTAWGERGNEKWILLEELMQLPNQV